MPSIIDAWFFSSEKMTVPGTSFGERRQCGVVSRVGRGKQQRGFFSVQVRKFALEFHVIVGRPRDIARAAGTRASSVDRLVHGRDDLWMLAHAKVIVGAPHGHLARLARRVMIGRWKKSRGGVSSPRTRGIGLPGEGTLAAAGASHQSSCRSPRTVTDN